MADKRKPRKLGRPSRIYETIHEARCPACGDWIRAPILRAHYEGRHPKADAPKEIEIREIAIPERIVQYVEAGNYVEAAAAACGIHVDTLYGWVAVGDEWRGTAVEEIPADRRIFVDFSDALRNAREAAQAKLLREIERQAPHDWRAAAWMLERTHPGRYSRIERLRVGGDGDAAPIRVEHVEKDPSFIEEVMTLYRGAGVLPDVGSVDNNGHAGNGNGKRPE